MLHLPFHFLCPADTMNEAMYVELQKEDSHTDCQYLTANCSTDLVYYSSSLYVTCIFHGSIFKWRH